MHPYCAGLDVHQKSVVACALVGEPGATPEMEKKTFSATTRGLLALSDWLRERGVTHVAMESTGVYWKPVWAILEGSFHLILANAAFVKNMPGNKTDSKDAAWLADLLRHGLIRASFVPPLEIQDLRELTRYRTQVSADRATVGNRIRKLLEGANLKLGSVATDVMGVSGRRILEAIIAGETDAAKLADHAVSHLRKKLPELEQAMEGRIREHHRRLLRLELAQWKFLDRLIEELDQAIAEAVLPFQPKLAICESIPGIRRISALTLVAELGCDMGQFPSAAHVASWAALCPGNNESAGKRLSVRTRKGNPWLKRGLCQAAWAAASTKNTYFSAQFRRLCAKRGKKRAILAVAHSLLAVAYTLLKTGRRYQDLGADYFIKLDEKKYKRHYLRGLRKLGYKVTLEPAAA
jgi:transposase